MPASATGNMQAHLAWLRDPVNGYDKEESTW